MSKDMSGNAVKNPLLGQASGVLMPGQVSGAAGENPAPLTTFHKARYQTKARLPCSQSKKMSPYPRRKKTIRPMSFGRNILGEKWRSGIVSSSLFRI